MEWQHFVYGLFNGYGYVLVKTDGVDTLLNEKMMQELCALREDRQFLWPPQYPNTEHIISCSHIEKVEDDFRREGLFNSTILIPLNEYLQYTQPLRLVKPWFTAKSTHPPNKLSPIRVE